MVDALITEFEKHCKDAIPLINFTVILAQLWRTWENTVWSEGLALAHISIPCVTWFRSIQCQCWLVVVNKHGDLCPNTIGLIFQIFLLLISPFGWELLD
jgi:hypothetical protein